MSKSLACHEDGYRLPQGNLWVGEWREMVVLCQIADQLGIALHHSPCHIRQAAFIETDTGCVNDSHVIAHVVYEFGANHLRYSFALFSRGILSLKCPNPVLQE